MISDKFTNTELLCFALGWQGGTIHQVAKKTGLTTCQILNLDRHKREIPTPPTKERGICLGASDEKLMNYISYRGIIPFWEGVIIGKAAYEERKR